MPNRALNADEASDQPELLNAPAYFVRPRHSAIFVELRPQLVLLTKASDSLARNWVTT
jgi:hypothetical protein